MIYKTDEYKQKRRDNFRKFSSEGVNSTAIDFDDSFNLNLLRLSKEQSIDTNHQTSEMLFKKHLARPLILNARNPISLAFNDSSELVKPDYVIETLEEPYPESCSQGSKTVTIDQNYYACTANADPD